MSSSKPKLVKPAKESTETSLAVDRSGGHVIKFEDEDGGLFLTPDGLKTRGKPAFGSYENAMAVAVYMEEKSPFWKADLLEYAHTRADWAGFLEQVIDAGTFTKRSIDQMRYVSRAVPLSRRVEGVSFTHHAEVASLEPDDQEKYLKRAKSEHLSASELRRVVRKERKVRKVLKGQASELAQAHDRVVEHAHEAAHLCREIPTHDCANAERLLKKARTELDRVEDAITKYRKVQGKA